MTFRYLINAIKKKLYRVFLLGNSIFFKSKYDYQNRREGLKRGEKRVKTATEGPPYLLRQWPYATTSLRRFSQQTSSVERTAVIIYRLFQENRFETALSYFFFPIKIQREARKMGNSKAEVTDDSATVSDDDGATTVTDSPSSSPPPHSSSLSRLYEEGEEVLAYHNQCVYKAKVKLLPLFWSKTLVF